MNIAYQPIVTLTEEHRVVGYEALTRDIDGEQPEPYFAAAWERSEAAGVSLEVAAAELAIRNFNPDVDGAFLAINASAKTIVATKGLLVRELSNRKLDMPLVVELSEHDEIDNYLALEAPMAYLLGKGVRFSIDDVGKGSANLWTISQIMPQAFKIDMQIVHTIESSAPSRAVVSALVQFGRRLNMFVVAEGIETEQESDWCTILGVDFGQGYLFGRPSLPTPKASNAD